MTTKKLVATVLGAQALGALVQIVSGPILSRLVGPYPFGFFAPVLSVAAVGRIVAESGLKFHVLSAPALKAGEAKDLHHKSIEMALLASIPAGLAAASIGGVSFEERVIRGLLAAILVVFAGIGAVPAAWIQRNGGLGKLSWWTVGLSAASSAIAIPLGMVGLGIESVVANNFLVMTALPLYTFYASGLAKVQKIKAHVAAEFRWGTLGASTTFFLASGADSFVLATYLNTSTLGIYTRVSVLAALAGNVVAIGLMNVGHTAMSTRVASKDQLRYLAKAVLMTVGVFSIPILLSLCGVDVPAIAFGHKFEVTPRGFQYIALSSALFFTGNILNTYHQANRRTTQQTVPYLLHAAIELGGFLILRPTSIEAIGLLLLVASLSRFILLTLISLPYFRMQVIVDQEPAPIDTVDQEPAPEESASFKSPYPRPNPNQRD